MKARLKPLLFSAVCLIAAPLVFYAGRAAGLYLLARACTALNLNADTYSVAPQWMKYLADRADALATALGLCVELAAGLFLRELFKPARVRFKPIWLALPCAASALGAGLIMLLRALDEVRGSGEMYRSDALMYILCAFFCACAALYLRECVCRGIQAALGPISAACASGILQALGTLAFLGGFNALAAINALLLGALLEALYLISGSVWPEALISFGFALGSRVISGYPDGGAYYVSGSALGGGAPGLTGSLMLTFILVLSALFCAFNAFRRFKNGSKAAVHS